MQQKSLILILVFLICIGISEIQAQTAVSVSGGKAVGSGGNTSYTIGQVFYNSIVGANGSIQEGVQQVILIETTIGIEHTANINLKCTAYPNPTNDILTLSIDNYENENLSYQLIDLSGKTLKTSKITNQEIEISTINLIPAIYFLIVTDNLQEIKSFKIIKN